MAKIWYRVFQVIAVVLPIAGLAEVERLSSTKALCACGVNTVLRAHTFTWQKAEHMNSLLMRATVLAIVCTTTDVSFRCSKKLHSRQWFAEWCCMGEQGRSSDSTALRTFKEVFTPMQATEAGVFARGRKLLCETCPGGLHGHTSPNAGGAGKLPCAEVALLQCHFAFKMACSSHHWQC